MMIIMGVIALVILAIIIGKLSQSHYFIFWGDIGFFFQLERGETAISKITGKTLNKFE